MILNILLFSFLFDWYYKMESPQNGDTWGGPPPPPPPSPSSDATVLCSGLYFRVRAGFRLELIGSFTTVQPVLSREEVKGLTAVT